ncbi:MAG: hypothetical protein HYY95_27645 [Candidatus Rokubacteria bacterium]|nr:hypothetical protein [Candidatus Rokubacteria bacterium]MBI3109303.1 hypothetical protein [Candidatus Rokubacteria bacterium]
MTCHREEAGQFRLALLAGNARAALSMATGASAGLHVLRRGPHGGEEQCPADFVLGAGELRIRAAGLDGADPDTAARWALEPWLRGLTTD